MRAPWTWPKDERPGPFVMAYRANRDDVGAMFSTSTTAWALSFGVHGRAVLIGWVYFGHRDRRWEYPPRP